MEQLQLLHHYQFSVDSFDGTSQADQLRAALRHLFAFAAGEQRVHLDVAHRIFTIQSSIPLDEHVVIDALAAAGFQTHALAPAPMVSTPASKKTDPASASSRMQKTTICIDGMTCHSCEVIIERKWRKLPNVRHVDVQANAGTATITTAGPVPSVALLQRSLGEGKYTVRQTSSPSQTDKPSFWQLVGLFALVLVLGKVLSDLGILNRSFAVGAGMSLGAIFVVGLVAASSSCIAVSGGLLLSCAARFNERYGSSTPTERMRPVILFVLGRVAGYGFLGGLLGVVGKALSPSPMVTAGVALLAAVYMLVMGLDMLHIAPAWMKRLMPSMPKSLSHKVMDAEGREHPLMPILLGAATFFLPCGFTQALQLYALTTGSFVTGALSLGMFALGTAPALTALGWASSSLKGKTGRFFLRFSGALVVVLGLWNMQNALTVAGVSNLLPRIAFAPATEAATTTAPADLVPVVDGKQIVKMSVGAGYEPDHFTIRAGTPVRWEIDATNGGGCASVLVSQQLRIQKLLDQSPNNVIEFTPTITGEVPFSCSMGMYRGSFTILPAA